MATKISLDMLCNTSSYSYFSLGTDLDHLFLHSCESLLLIILGLEVGVHVCAFVGVHVCVVADGLIDKG